MSAELEHGKHYHCRVKLRRSESYRVKPQCEPLEGRTFVLTPLFRLGAEDHQDAQGRPLYAGEFAMGEEPGGPRPLYACGITWIASGDLEILGPGST